MHAAADVVDAGCPLFLSGFDPERRVAIGQMLRYTRASGFKPCATGDRIYALSWRERTLSSPLLAMCRRWHMVWDRLRLALLSCSSQNRLDLSPRRGAATQNGVYRLRPPGRLRPPVALYEGSQSRR